jgi:hypothetical protein
MMARVSNRPEHFCHRRPVAAAVTALRPVSKTRTTFISPALPAGFRNRSGEPARGHDGSSTQETTMTTKTEAIRALNDELRQNLTTGTALMTAGVAALGAEAVARIVKTIAVYDDFCHANDPYEEHDFGSFEVNGHTIFFKIDYYDKSALLSLARPI